MAPLKAHGDLDELHGCQTSDELRSVPYVLPLNRLISVPLSPPLHSPARPLLPFHIVSFGDLHVPSVLNPKAVLMLLVFTGGAITDVLRLFICSASNLHFRKVEQMRERHEHALFLMVSRGRLLRLKKEV